MIIEKNTKQIIDIAFAKGNKHDFDIFKSIKQKFATTTKFLADLGYLGIKNYFPNSIIPKKTSKYHSLSCEEKVYNKIVSSERIKVEHTFAFFKKFAIFSTTFRESWRRFNNTFMAVASLYC